MSTRDVVVHPDGPSLAARTGDRLLVTVIDALDARGRADIALTGGSMGSAVVAALAQHPSREHVDWSRVHFWWGDERYLPAGDPDRNDAQGDAAGLGAVAPESDHVHRVAGPDTTGSAEEAARLYEEALRTHGSGVFDAVLLGVGGDGHVASLFPGHPRQRSNDTIAVAVHHSPKPPPTRVSLTAECLSRARKVWFVVSGPEKAEAVRDGVTGAPASRSSTGLVHGQEETLWLVDQAAARLVGSPD